MDVSRLRHASHCAEPLHMVQLGCRLCHHSYSSKIGTVMRVRAVRAVPLSTPKGATRVSYPHHTRHHPARAHATLPSHSFLGTLFANIKVLQYANVEVGWKQERHTSRPQGLPC